MFKRPSVHYGRAPEPVTPYQRAAQVWDERIGSARLQAKNWRLMAFGSLFLSAGLASSLIWQSTKGTITPWVVEVDRLGQTQAVAPASAFHQPTDPQIAFHLARFIEDVRGLPADAIVLRQSWLRAYDFTTDRGAGALNDYARNNDPFAKLGSTQISIEVSSVIRASPDSFGSPGPSVATTTANSLPPSAGQRSSPLSSKLRAMLTACARIRSASMSMQSIGRRSSRSDGVFPILLCVANSGVGLVRACAYRLRHLQATTNQLRRQRAAAPRFGRTRRRSCTALACAAIVDAGARRQQG
jgi:type IV secretory pathway TrbF-like protein